MAERRKRSRKRASMYSDRFSLHGSLKYDSFSMPVSNRKISSGKNHSQSSANKSLGQVNADIKENNGFCINAEETVAASGELPTSPMNSDKDLYCHLLKSTGSYMPLDSMLKAFVLLDWDKATRFLKQSSPLLVQRFGSRYTCTCCPDRTSFVNNIEASADETDTFHPPCVHISAIKDIVSEYACITGQVDFLADQESEEHAYSKAASYGNEEENEHIIPFLEDMYVLCCDNGYSVLKTSFGKLKCLFCKNSGSCEHTKTVFNELNAQDQYSDSLDKIYTELHAYKSKKPYQLKCLSHKKIPFSMNNIQTKTTDLFSMIDGVLQVFPEAVVCQACGNDFEGEAEPLEQTCYFITKYECVPTKVYQRLCKGCNSCNSYDGQLDCVFNMDRFLIHHEVLRDFMFHFLYSRATMFSFYSVWIQHQADNGNSHFSTLFSYMYFRQSWFCFLSLLDIDYIHDFVCKDCGPRPEILLFDGTSLSFKKSFLPPEPVIDSKATKFIGSSHEERVFVNNRATRDLLHKYSQLKTSIEPEEFKSLKSLLSIHQPALVPLLEAFENVGCVSSPPEEYAGFLNVLSKNSPVCGTFPFAKINILKNIIDEASLNASNLSECQNYMPVLYRLLSKLQNVSENLKFVLKAVIHKVEAPFINRNIHVSSACNHTEHSLAFYPNLPCLRDRGLYVTDKEKNKNGCTKKGTRHPVLLPGIFTVFCPHGICYGFEVMECAESPNRPFTFLKTRFEKAPAVIIYDNACNLHQYCLNRDPVFFSNTLMVVDGLHWDNHSGCSVGYKALDYPILRGINTQTVEQNNSKLKKLKSSLSYMTSKHFMDSLRFFMWHSNKTVKRN